MTDSVRLGRILGIPIGVNWSIVAVAALFTVGLAVQALPRSAPDAGIGARLAVAAAAIVVFFASILAHEIGHAIAARVHGVGVHGITLWLLGGVAKLDRQAPTARAEFQIAIAGPAVSFALGVFFVSLTIIVLAVAPAPLLVAVIGWLAGVNLILAVFNLLPAAPLDGGRVLTAALWRRWGDAEQARIVAGRFGLVLAVVLVTIGVIQVIGLEQPGGWVTALVGAFSFGAAKGEIATAVVRRRLATTTVGSIAVRYPSVVPDTVTLRQLLDAVGPDGETIGRGVVRWDTDPIGYVVPAAVVDGMDEAERAWTTVGQVMVPAGHVERVDAATATGELLRRWERRATPLAVVTASDGQAIGTVTDHQIRPLLRPPDLWGRDRLPPGPEPVPGTAGPTPPVSARPMG